MTEVERDTHPGAAGQGRLSPAGYLANALEISGPSQLGYGPGNHDGLCESGEHCLYAPNFGAYQGEGDLGTCELGGSAVTGVTMYGYASNGVR